MKKLLLIWSMVWMPHLLHGQTSPLFTPVPLNRTIFTNNDTFEGYRFRVMEVHGQPVIKAEFVVALHKGDGKFHIVRTKEALFVRPYVDPREEKKVEDQLASMKTFIPQKTVKIRNHPLGVGGEAGGLSRFDSLDQNGTVRISRWFDEKYSFKVRSAIYDESGRLLSLTFYSNTRFDRDFDGQGPKRRVLRLKLTNVLKKLKDVKGLALGRFPDVEDFCRMILREVIETNVLSDPSVK